MALDFFCYCTCGYFNQMCQKVCASFLQHEKPQLTFSSKRMFSQFKLTHLNCKSFGREFYFISCKFIRALTDSNQIFVD